MNGKVVVTRAEVGRMRDLATELLSMVDGILERPEPRPVERDSKGWPVLGDPEEKP